MNRKPWCILIAACVCAGCATRPASETQAVAARIARERPEIVRCSAPDIRYCQSDDGRLSCVCTLRSNVLGPQ